MVPPHLEALAATLRQRTGVQVSVTTVAPMLRDLGARWGRARPTVLSPWSKVRKARRLRAIKEVPAHLRSDEVAYFEDEVDIHLNPRIGRDCALRGQQKVVVTPGQNRTRYLAGTLVVNGRDLLNSARARRLHPVLDNYGIHSSRRVRAYLTEHGSLFQLHFLPPYSPEHNAIERLWREVHANVTGIHRCKTINELMRRVTWHLCRHAARLRRHTHNHRAGNSSCPTRSLKPP